MNFPEASGAFKDLKKCPLPHSPEKRFFFFFDLIIQTNMLRVSWLSSI